MKITFPVQFRGMTEPFRDFLVMVDRRPRVNGSPHSLNLLSQLGFKLCRGMDEFGRTDLYAAAFANGESAEGARVLSGYVFGSNGLLGLELQDAERLVSPLGIDTSLRGNFVAVELRVGEGGATEVDVLSDAFGLQPLFVVETPQIDLLSNRYHLTASVAADLGLVTAVDSSLMATAMFADSVVATQIATNDLPIRPIRMLPPGSKVAVRRGQMHVHQLRPTTTHRTYGDLLERGVDELLINARSIVEEKRIDSRVLNLTGGFDSRMILSLFRHMGETNSLSALTLKLNDEEDFELAVRLAAYANLSYRPPKERRPHAPSNHLSLWRSLQFGLYHDLGVSRYLEDPIGPRTVRLIGGCGEVYRGYYQKIFPEESLNASGAEAGDAVHRYVTSFKVWSLLTPLDPDGVADHVQRSILSMPGELLREKLDEWYFHFRNRTHFGAQSAMSRYVSTLAVSPLISPSLRAAAQRLDPIRRESGQVVFDVLTTLDPALASLPFSGGGWDPRLKQDSEVLDFDVDLADAEARWQSGQHPSDADPPTGSSRPEWYSYAKDTMQSARALLSLAGSEYQFVDSSAFQGRMDWTLDNRPHVFRWWVSRLAAAADALATSKASDPCPR